MKCTSKVTYHKRPVTGFVLLQNCAFTLPEWVTLSYPLHW